MKCFDCGGEGHIAANCTNTAFDASGKPPWCGFCDERTRLVIADDLAARCQQCHPLRHRQLKQHRKCPTCHMTVYEWDNAPCGHHKSPVGVDHRPDKEHIDAIIAAERKASDG